MSDLNILIVEDDLSFALEIEMLLDELGYVKYKLVKNASKASVILSNDPPDAAIIDIYLEGQMSGLELAQHCQKLKIPVIFSTAYGDRDLYEQARLTNPFAYLIKPYNKLTLEHTLRMLVQPEVEALMPSADEVQADQDHIFLRSQNKLNKVLFDQINWIQSEGNYCIIQTEGRRYVLKMPLKKIFTRLPDAKFYRIHRSYIVNLSVIDQVNTVQNTVWITGLHLPIGRTYRAGLFKKLNMV
ncbi:MAG: response regulator transcription factor [Bacteroidota bacterium]